MSPSAYGNTSGSDVRESRELMSSLMTFSLGRGDRGTPL